MAKRSTVYLTTGAAGSGKTYRRCARFLVDEFLPNERGHIYCNYPLYAEKMADEVSRRHKIPKEQILERIHVIDKEELDTWMINLDRRDTDRARGPWTYFQDIDIDNAHIAIDEIHNFCGVSTPRHQRQKWGKWLGEIRHRGATVEFLTQSPNKLADEIKWEASVLINLISGETNRDPICKISMSHWYELQAAITGEYEKRIHQIEKRSIDGRWRMVHKETFTLDSYYFQFYDSYAAPHTGGVTGSAEKHQFQKHGRLGVFWWFLKQNLWPVSSRLIVFCLFMWVMFFGGGKFVFDSFLGKLGDIAKQQTTRTHKPNITQKTKQKDKISQVIKTQEATQKKEQEQQKTDKIEKELKTAQEENSSLREQLKKESAIALITKDSVVLTNGYTYSIGDVIDYGEYKDKKVSKILWKKRQVILCDGLILRMEN